jgi:hypothetical protein
LTDRIKPAFFRTPAALREWLERHADDEQELLVGFYKTGSGKTSITWPESVDEVLCFGWIDGVRKRIDDVSYTIRFTPRRRTSIWSLVNIKRVAELTEQGRMSPAGLKAFAARRENKSGVYSHEKRPDALVCEPAGQKAGCAEVLRRAGTVLPTCRHLVGDQRKKRRDAAEAGADTHRLVGGGEVDSAVHAVDAKPMSVS